MIPSLELCIPEKLRVQESFGWVQTLPFSLQWVYGKLTVQHKSLKSLPRLTALKFVFSLHHLISNLRDLVASDPNLTLWHIDVYMVSYIWGVKRDKKDETCYTELSQKRPSTLVSFLQLLTTSHSIRVHHIKNEILNNLSHIQILLLVMKCEQN